MEGLVALYLVYWILKVIGETTVNVVAALKGRPVVIRNNKATGGEKAARYTTAAAGSFLGALLWLFYAAAANTTMAADAKYGDRIRAKRAERRAARRGTPADASEPAGADDGYVPVEYHCVRCGANLTDRDDAIYAPSKGGWICAVHDDDACA